MDDLTNAEMILLLEYQLNPLYHPYTCNCGLNLYPINKGWICGICGYSQKYGLLEMIIIGRISSKELLYG